MKCCCFLKLIVVPGLGMGSMVSFPSDELGERNSLLQGNTYSLLMPKHLPSIFIFPEKLRVQHPSTGSLFREPSLQMLNRTSQRCSFISDDCRLVFSNNSDFILVDHILLKAAQCSVHWNHSYLTVLNRK